MPIIPIYGEYSSFMIKKRGVRRPKPGKQPIITDRHGPVFGLFLLGLAPAALKNYTLHLDSEFADRTA